MDCDEFNLKYKDHLEDRHYGMSIGIPSVIDYLDKEFEEEIKTNPSFSFTQIKLKFHMARVYTNSEKSSTWEKEVDKLVAEHDLTQKLYK